ncbi:MAG: hypothetical protein ACHQEB_01640 [Chitinophagales bacterium]
MKRILLLLLVFFSGGSIISAQKTPIINLYAFSQQVLPGMRQSSIAQENGGEIKQAPVEKINYFFYAEQTRSSKVIINAIWVKGKKYAAKTDSISKTPVEITIIDSTSKPEKITLVPASVNKILLIIPAGSPETAAQPSGSLKKLVKKSELVVVYQWKGEIYYSTVQKIKKLGPFASV